MFISFVSKMISLSTHLFISSFKLLGPVRQVLNNVLPYATMGTKSKINFNTRHLKKGDPLPPFNGKLRVYNMRYCPYAQRTILALNAKNIDYEVINVNLKDKPDWLFVKSPFGKVPAIEVKEGETVYESLVTVEYLDDIYPQSPLLPKDPLLKAFDKIIIESSGGISAFFYKTIMKPESVDEESIANYHKSLKFVEDEIIRRGTKFLDGELPGYGDYMIWPWFERIVQITAMYPQLVIDDQKYKRLNQYIKDMFVDPAVSQYLVPNDIFIKYLTGHKSGNVNYDLLNE